MFPAWSDKLVQPIGYFLVYSPLGDYRHTHKPHKCFVEKFVYWHTGEYRWLWRDVTSRQTRGISSRFHGRPKLWGDVTQLWIMKKCIGDSNRSQNSKFTRKVKLKLTYLVSVYFLAAVTISARSARSSEKFAPPLQARNESRRPLAEDWLDPH